MRGSKIPVQELWLKMGGGRNSGILRYHFFYSQIVSASPNDLQDYTYYFVPAPWLTVKLVRLLQCFDIPGNLEL